MDSKFIECFDKNLDCKFQRSADLITKPKEVKALTKRYRKVLIINSKTVGNLEAI